MWNTGQPLKGITDMYGLTWKDAYNMLSTYYVIDHAVWLAWTIWTLPPLTCHPTQNKLPKPYNALQGHMLSLIITLPPHSFRWPPRYSSNKPNMVYFRAFVPCCCLCLKHIHVAPSCTHSGLLKRYHFKGLPCHIRSPYSPICLQSTYFHSYCSLIVCLSSNRFSSLDSRTVPGSQ